MVLYSRKGVTRKKGVSAPILRKALSSPHTFLHPRRTAQINFPLQPLYSDSRLSEYQNGSCIPIDAATVQPTIQAGSFNFSVPGKRGPTGPPSNQELSNIQTMYDQSHEDTERSQHSKSLKDKCPLPLLVVHHLQGDSCPAVTT